MNIIRTVKEEKELLDHRFVVAAHYQLQHFRGFYPLLFGRLQDLDIVCCEQRLSETFLEKYRGFIVILTKYRTSELMKRPGRHYKTVMIDHGPLPPGPRSWERYDCDYLIASGSHELLKHVDLKSVGKTILDGYFPHDYFLPEREKKRAMIQITSRGDIPFQTAEISRILLNLGFEVLVYGHVLFKTDLSNLPEGVRIVKPGIDYVQELSKCSHFLFHGTSGFLTSMYSQGCTMIALGEHWIRKNRSIFSKIMNRASYTADNMGEVIRFLDHPARYDLDLTEFLFGRDRGSVIEKIRQTFLSLGSGEID